MPVQKKVDKLCRLGKVSTTTKKCKKVNRRFNLGGGVLKIGGRFTFFCNVVSSVTCLSGIVISQFYTILGKIMVEYL